MAIFKVRLANIKNLVTELCVMVAQAASAMMAKKSFLPQFSPKNAVMVAYSQIEQHTQEILSPKL